MIILIKEKCFYVLSSFHYKITTLTCINAILCFKLMVVCIMFERKKSTILKPSFFDANLCSQQSNFLMLFLYFIFTPLFWNNNASSKIKMLQNAKQNVIEIISSYRSSFSFKSASLQLSVLKNERQKMNVSDPTKQLCLQHFLLCFHLIRLLKSFFIVHCCFNSLLHNSDVRYDNLNNFTLILISYFNKKNT